MKANTALLKALFVLASAPLWAQQAPPTSPQTTPATPQSPSSQSPSAPENPATQSPAPQAAEAPAAPLSAVSGELVSKLDSSTAKAGDDVVIQTKSSVKTADGTEIPKGSKLKGHIIGVQASQSGTNSQVALKFDQIELKGGQTLPIQSQIQSISPAGSADASGGPSAAASSRMAGPGNSSAAGPSSAGVAPNRSSAGMGTSPQSGATPNAGGATGSAPTTAGAPPAGTVIAKSGQIAIATTAVPGVLLANNAPGEQDPRMARVSTVLLGAKKDIQLDGGTEMVVGIAPASGTR
ncbi:hypothetical protein ACFPT7_19815 [Acidicapsa dinghuensis]|uniref:DUF5666 domain-containing protein n=1 Tax=Acidicapsa dinghuensis TaxID=2218256 RepID=A0ABW1EMN6_9BACT|nr:hypothetical protein [Acidicapsa dinghuensis]